MIVAIRHIDFERRAITIESNGWSNGRTGILRDYLTQCVRIGYDTVCIVHPAKITRDDVKRLKVLGKDCGVKSLETRTKRPKPRASSRGTTFSSVYPRSGSRKSNRVIEFTIDSQSFDSMLHDVKDFVTLVAHSIPLTTRVLSRLRLSIYELAVNSVEHGWFTDPRPQIDINVRISQGAVEVTYRDNGAEFRTTTRSKVNIKNQIDRRRKRGLGLFMIAKVAEELQFERKGKWNCTSFMLQRFDQGQAKRSNAMEDFSVEVIPFKTPDTVTLKPKGSVDSNTAGALESSFRQMIESGIYRIVVDLSGTDFISSAGLGLILGTVSTLRENGGDMILMKIPQGLADIFELMSVEDYFETIDSIDDLEVHKS